MSKLLANQISNYNDNGPVEAKDGINVANGKPLQVAGTNGTSGQFLKSTGSSVAWQDFPTIPAAQVNADWNATSGVAQISNKPALHAVATSGQYSDLSGLPSIPAAQIQSDWNTSNTSSVDFIKNKPTLFSGSYTDLTGKPSIPLNLQDLADVSPATPSNSNVLKWNGSNWAPAVDADTNTIVNIKVTVGDETTGNNHSVTAATYNPTSGDMVLTIGTHTLTTADQIRIWKESLTFTCDYNGNGNTTQKKYPRATGAATSNGADYAYNTYLPITAVTGTTITVNVNGGQGPVTDTTTHNFVLTASATNCINVRQASGVFYMDGVESPKLNIERRTTYIFHQSDSSNATYASMNHPLMFSPTEDGELVSGGTHYMTGVVYKLDGVNKTMAEYTAGFVAATTRTVEWTVADVTPNELWYWCHHHTGQGNSIRISNSWNAVEPTRYLDVSVGTDTVNGQATGVYYIDGVESPELNLERGVTYRFDQSGATCSEWPSGSGMRHPLMFSTTEDGDLVVGGTHYYPGITYKLDGVVVTMAHYTMNFASAKKKTITFKIPDDAPDTLWYWCHHHTGQGNKINVSNTWQAPSGGGGSYGNSDVDAHLNQSNPTSGHVLSWNGSDYAWVAQSGGGGGGSTTFVGLTDTPANFTSQAGKYLKVNAGATALEYVTLPVDPDTNTTYSQSSVADGSNVKLRLTDSGSTNDDILLTAGTNISFSSVTAAGFTINHSGSAPASVVTDDNAPSSPSDGDLWWKSDEGRLKVYYADGSSDQWVDASPVLSPTSMTSGSNSISVTSTRSTVTGPLRITGTLTGNSSNNQLAYASHFIPDTNAAYDIGSAEYKVRHLFLSDNTVYFQGDFLKVAQHNSGGSAQSASYLIPLAKLKDALNASADYEAFKTAILAITDA